MKKKIVIFYLHGHKGNLKDEIAILLCIEIRGQIRANIIEFSRDMKSGRIQILNGQKEVGLQMVWISNGI